MDDLTPLDARNSLLLDRSKTNESSITITYANANAMSDYKQPINQRDSSPDQYIGIAIEPINKYSSLNASYSRPLTPNTPMGGLNQSSENLVANAAPVGRQPTLPNVGGGYGNYGYGQQNGYSGYRAPSGY